MAGENRNGAVELDFGDGARRFRLGMGELEELQEKTGVGPFRLVTRLLDGEWTVVEVRETLRLGLIGGGLEPLNALKLIRRYVVDRPDWVANAAIARLVVMAAIAGAPEEEPGKGGAPEAASEEPNFRTVASPSAPTTEQQPPAEWPSPTSGE
ncbi:gene transfer agent family protein [Chelatococcus sp.]|uniref:gene transfer agent family protein n=1 Tax=Chelatococcus sp. TaxID=1953771 RepID=UPI001EB9046B|nr:gene transfer agent family protein [Chelatococcus sp.]MBX3543579.1 gene transfer agent family protein [Chelatococcus sp.]